LTVPEFLFGEAPSAAPLLLGWHLLSTVGGQVTEVELTEVEAYSQEDPASHSFGGVRPRNEVMYGVPGRLYVYRSYGMHWCANVVCGPDGIGAAVLLRAGKPVKGAELMARRRGRINELTTGPGNLCQALGITDEHRGQNLFNPASAIRLVPGNQPVSYIATPRVGISKGVETRWRFVAQA
jgi:DNA-3-methyladenine glycosylase